MDRRNDEQFGSPWLAVPAFDLYSMTAAPHSGPAGSVFMVGERFIDTPRVANRDQGARYPALDHVVSDCCCSDACLLVDTELPTASSRCSPPFVIRRVAAVSVGRGSGGRRSATGSLVDRFAQPGCHLSVRQPLFVAGGIYGADMLAHGSERLTELAARCAPVALAGVNGWQGDAWDMTAADVDLVVEVYREVLAADHGR